MKRYLTIKLNVKNGDMQDEDEEGSTHVPTNVSPHPWHTFLYNGEWFEWC